MASQLRWWARRSTWTAGILLIPLIAVYVGFVAQPWHVAGTSMEPAIGDGSMVLVDAMGPHLMGYRRGDVVILPVPPSVPGDHRVLLKRIVGVGGDRVDMEHGRVTVNSRAELAPYLRIGTTTPTTPAGVHLLVPAGSVFVMGDHRDGSFDSRSFGPVPVVSLLGRAWLAAEPDGSLALPGVFAASAP